MIVASKQSLINTEKCSPHTVTPLYRDSAEPLIAQDLVQALHSASFPSPFSVGFTVMEKTNIITRENIYNVILERKVFITFLK